MTASDLYKAGRLSDAVAAQIQDVKAQPGDHGKRVFLFELAAFAGDLDRARRQIEAVSSPEPELLAAAQRYRKLLDAEEARRKLFRDGVRPQFVSDPPPHVTVRLEAVDALRSGRPADAADLLKRANEEAPPVGGRLNGAPVAGLRDADDLFAHVLEVLVEGRYVWVPLEQVDTVAANPPRFPRDLLWAPARLTTQGGETGEVFLPALYPNTHEHPDEQVKLGRATDWKELPGGVMLGVGLRTFLAGEDVSTVPEWRELAIDAAAPAGG